MLLAAIVVEMPTAKAAKINFAGTQQILPSSAMVFVTTTDIETGVVIDSVRSRPRANVNVKCSSRFCIAAAQATAKTKLRRKPVLREFFGVSKAFGEPPLNAAARRVIRIKGQTVNTASAVLINGKNPIPSLAESTVTAPQMRVEVPNDAFELSGTVAQQTISLGIAAMVITGLTHSPCYDRSDSFVVVESDPRMKAMRQREFELIKSGFAASDPDFVDRAESANASVRGTVTSQGDSATVSIKIVDTAGKELQSSEVNVSKGGWLAAVDQASLELGGKLCTEPKVDVKSVSCQLKSCSCGNDTSGYQVLLSMAGSATLPIGGIVYTTIPKNPSAIQNCGGATETALGGGALACRRTSADEPESFNWSAQSSTPVPPSCQCDGAPQTMPFVATAMDRTATRRDDKIFEAEACSEIK